MLMHTNLVYTSKFKSLPKHPTHDAVMCIKPLKIVMDLVQLKKNCTDSSIYQQLFHGNMRQVPCIFLFILVHWMGILWLVL